MLEGSVGDRRGGNPCVLVCFGSDGSSGMLAVEDTRAFLDAGTPWWPRLLSEPVAEITASMGLREDLT